ncbi:MAG: hypothetical protein HGA59_06955 [Chlorobiaceae bacterium]|jgi:hypothetical protein|nr:hypothetical protein [Chlorobiaceae bacterium]NTV17456.1 hypothetical protein [Chlorobiaceae bacterium]
MTLLFPEKKFLINWLKALMLSPGILFPAGYLLVYLSTNIYLNTDFKKNLSTSVNQSTGNTWHISIKSLKSGLVFNSVTLHNVELTPTTAAYHEGDQSSTHSITIKTLEIASPELDKLLFSPTARLLSTKAVSEKILADKHFVQ